MKRQLLSRPPRFVNVAITSAVSTWISRSADSLTIGLDVASATGGVFYRDSALPMLTTRYICGDYGSGRIWSISRDGSSVIELTDLRLSTNRIVDFQVDPVTKDIFVLENGGSNRVMRITIQPPGPED